MIKGSGIYDVLSTLIPLYVATLLGYGSVKWWKLFSPEQCSGINKFVATFAIPFLTFHFISSNNIYDLNFRFIAADSLHKVIVLVLLVVFNYSKYGDLDWSITCYSISALPNSLLIGVPLLKAMYGDFSTSLMVQIVVSQSVVWLVLLLILLEYRKAKVEQSSNVGSSDDLEKQHSVPLSRDGSSKVTRSESDDSVIEHTVSSPSGRQEKDNGDTNQVSVITKILTTVGKKLAQNPTIYGSVLGLIWSLISFRWKIHLPKIIEGCVTILSSTGLGMAMFSIGLFISLQPKIITCGKKEAAISMAIRFLVSPAIIAATSLVIGLRGDLLRVAIVQGALPQSVSTFVFAKEYNCHAGILCTAVIFGMAAAIPITILYYVLLGLK